ncbi:MAG: trigger factor [Eggerthellaceae bacterium]|nr:trigger factor [Eggerthellaceae bacterium]
MRVTTKRIDDDTMRMECVASPKEVNAALDRAKIGFAQSMNVKPQAGKTLDQVVEEQLGIKNLDSIVSKTAIEALAPFALDKKNIIPAYPPKPDYSRELRRNEEFPFTLSVALKPEYELTSYDDVDIPLRPYKFNELLVEDQLPELASHNSNSEPIYPRPIVAKDTVVLAMKALQNGEEIKALTTDKRTYQMGEGFMPPDFDRALIGMEPGQTKEFSFELPGAPTPDGEQKMDLIECTVTIKELEKSVPPVMNDEWVKKNFPMYKSMDALKNDIHHTLESQERQRYEDQKTSMAVNAFAKRFNGKISDRMYESMRSALMQQLQEELQVQNMTWEQFVQQNGGEQQIGMMMMLQAREMLVNGFTLDAIYRHEKLALTDEDYHDTCRLMNPDVAPDKTMEMFEQTGRMFALRESAQRMKANKWIMAHTHIDDAVKEKPEKDKEPEAKEEAPKEEEKPAEPDKE